MGPAVSTFVCGTGQHSGVQDESIGISLGNTSYYTFIGVPLQLVLALALALLLNIKVRGLAIYRTLFYLPATTPIVASAIVWLQILHPEFGILNSFLRNFRIEPVNWLFDPRAAKPAFILMTLWGVGPQMVIFLAGLQGVPRSLYEAAEIDGTSRSQRFLFITIPMISSITFFNLVVGVIASFQVFTTGFIMTRGGPQNATLFLVLYLYRSGFQYFKMGYASAIAWMLFVIIVAFTFRSLRAASAGLDGMSPIDLICRGAFVATNQLKDGLSSVIPKDGPAMAADDGVIR